MGMSHRAKGLDFEFSQAPEGSKVCMSHQTCAGGYSFPHTHPSTSRLPILPSTAAAALPDGAVLWILCQPRPPVRGCVCNAGWALKPCRHIATSNARPHVCTQMNTCREAKGTARGSKEEGRVVVGHSPLEPHRRQEEPHPLSIFSAGQATPESYGSQAAAPRGTLPTKLRARSTVDEALV